MGRHLVIETVLHLGECCVLDVACCYFARWDIVSCLTRFPRSTLLPFFIWGVPLLKPNIRIKGNGKIQGLLGNLVW